MRAALVLEVVGVCLLAVSLGAIFTIWAGVGIVGIWLVSIARGI